jgi:hypothetical protein
VVFAEERLECVFALWLLLARPYMRQLTGSAFADFGESLPLARKITSHPGLSELVLLRRATSSTEAAQWEPLAAGGIPYSAIAGADAWLLVEPDSEGYAAGQDAFAQFL